MRVHSRVCRFEVAGLVVALMASACHDNTGPGPKPEQVGVEREWQYFGAHPGGSSTVLLGARHGQNEGTINDNRPLGPLAIHPRGVSPIAIAEVFSNDSATSYFVDTRAPRASTGGEDLDASGVELDQVYHYVVDAANPSLTYTLSDVFLEAIDASARFATPAECRRKTPSEECDRPIQSRAEYGIWAHIGHHPDDIVSRESALTMVGNFSFWDFRLATEDGDQPIIHLNDLKFDRDVDADGGHHAQLSLVAPLHIPVPMSGAQVGDTVVVQTRMVAWTEDRRQSEDYASAYLRDPVNTDGARFEVSGMHLVPPPVTPIVPHVQQPAPACSAGGGAAGTLQFDSTTFVSSESGFLSGTVTVTRTGGTSGLVSATVTTHDGTATAGSDYTPVATVVRFGDGEGGSRTVQVPLLGDSVVEADETINLTLGQPGGCATLGGQTTAVLTLRDDDTQAPPSTFSVGGTITGLQGSGLVLHDRTSGAEVNPTADGPFTIIPGREAGFHYDIVVATQPSAPLQVCTVGNGSGTLDSANVTNVAVTCGSPPQVGGLDTTFGSGGRAITDIGNGVTGMALQSDGKIVIVGDSKVQRLNPNGTLDTGFGSGGTAAFTFAGAIQNLPAGVAIQADGRIVVAGTIEPLSGQQCAVARYTGTGAPDPTFGTGGHLLVDFHGAGSSCMDVAIDASGRIVLAGEAVLGSGVLLTGDFGVARFTSSGAPDSTFGGDGIVTVDAGGSSEWANAVKLQGDGRIVLAGRSAPDGGSDPTVAVIRLMADGRTDSTFHNNGIDAADPGLGAASAEAYDVVIQSDGKVVVGGQRLVGAQFQYLVARFSQGGGLDPSFGSGGFTTTSFTAQGDVGRGLALLSGDSLVAVGRAAFFGVSDFGIARYSKDGVLDAAHQLSIDFAGGIDGANAVVVQPDGRMVVAGFAREGTGTGAGVVRIVP